MIATHYQIDFSEHYLADYMATRGIGFLGWNTRYRGYESSFLLDHALVDIGVGVRWLREVQGVETIVLLGNSGGGSLMAAYQAQAVDPHVTPLEGMRPAAGLDRPAARRRLHRQRRTSRAAPTCSPRGWTPPSSTKTTPSQPIPTSTCSTSATGRPTRRDFIERYRAAQIARNDAITDWAEAELKRVHAAGFSDRPFTVLRTWADPRMVDPTMEPTKRPANMCYAGRAGQGQPLGARHRRGVHAAQLAGHVEPAARADPRRTAPGPHRLPRPGDQRRTGHRACTPPTRSASTTRSPAPTRLHCAIDTDHYFTTPGARSEKADTIAKWIAKRWR